jgi:hypothetical protein
MYIPHRVRAFSALSAIALALASCGTTPEPVPAEPEPVTAVAEQVPVEEPVQPVVQAEPVPEPVQEADPVPFDPASVSSELKEATFFDVKALIQGLNSIIQAKDYESWLAVLSADYRDHYSSAETLARISDAAILKRQGIVLKSLQDYFVHVVYPSRQNDRVDDIEFIAPDRIRAIIINPKGERLVLYNLEKIGDTWKIAIWR